MLCCECLSHVFLHICSDTLYSLLLWKMISLKINYCNYLLLAIWTPNFFIHSLIIQLPCYILIVSIGFSQQYINHSRFSNKKDFIEGIGCLTKPLEKLRDEIGMEGNTDLQLQPQKNSEEELSLPILKCTVMPF